VAIYKALALSIATVVTGIDGKSVSVLARLTRRDSGPDGKGGDKDGITDGESWYRPEGATARFLHGGVGVDGVMEKSMEK
jgi:hypothetical protein